MRCKGNGRHEKRVQNLGGNLCGRFGDTNIDGKVNIKRVLSGSGRGMSCFGTVPENPGRMVIVF
jgi:hypothetical protein